MSVRVCEECPMHDPGQLGIECAFYRAIDPESRFVFGIGIGFFPKFTCLFSLTPDYNTSDLDSEGVRGVIMRNPNVITKRVVEVRDIIWPLKE